MSEFERFTVLCCGASLAALCSALDRPSLVTALTVICSHHTSAPTERHATRELQHLISQIRYFHSEFMGHATADDMASVFETATADLDFSSLIHILMDGPNGGWSQCWSQCCEKAQAGDTEHHQGISECSSACCKVAEEKA